ncbi:PQQ-binding-like beta-propeller repeat protein [Marivirga arenosa]|uniref:PQQ-binding-like beta-propeller repeat protein n=1 Tax=Marivirga arenosa TaxID=3059076 RepID=A0AA51RDE2_9BACT|nr:PQQ-binding-like beta-propeller repeat protein [Marivirga sp. ABR2-2]WMN07010.1 PQQ-binding-like beta-propeller repeat protein [Marivirga sp. ABR2-2]
MKFFLENNSISITIAFVYMSLISSCNLFQKPENKLSYPPVWKYNFSVGYFSSINPILYEDKVIYSGLDEKKNDFSANSTLEAFDKKNGRLIWKWADNIPESFDKFKHTDTWHIHADLLYISSGWEYAINIMNGTTRFSHNSQFFGGKSIVGYEEVIFTRFTFEDYSRETVYFSKSDFNWNELIAFNNNDSIRYYIDHLIIDGVDLLIPVLRGRQNFEPGELIFLKYNIFKKQFTAQDTIILDKERNRFIDAPPVLTENSLYLSLNGTVVCVNKNNFTIIWQRETNGNSSRSGIMYADNKLYVNTEFQLYALDAETGNILWQIDSSAGSRMQEHKGVVYYTDGISLRGVDAVSGEVLLEVEAPSRATDDGAFFQPVLTIDHENDRIYTASYTHAYCYPTLR